MEGRTLELSIISAEEVKQLKWTGKMSPYAVAWIYPELKVTTRACPEGGKNPKWNEKFELKVEDRHLEDPKSTLTIEIYSDGPFGPKQLGVVNIPFTEVTKDWKGDAKELQYMAYQIRRRSGRTQGVLNLAIALEGTQQVLNGTASPQGSSPEAASVETAEPKLTVKERAPTVEERAPTVEERAPTVEERYPTVEKVVTEEKAVTDEKAASEAKADRPALAVYPPPPGYAQGYPPAAYAYPPPAAYPVYAPVGYAPAFAPVVSPTAYGQGYGPAPPGYPQAYPQAYPQGYAPPAHAYPQGYPPPPYPVAYGGYPPPPQYYAAPGGQYQYPPQHPPKKSGFGGAGAGLGLGLGAGLLGGVLLGEALDGDCGDCGD